MIFYPKPNCPQQFNIRNYVYMCEVYVLRIPTIVSYNSILNLYCFPLTVWLRPNWARILMKVRCVSVLLPVYGYKRMYHYVTGLICRLGRVNIRTALGRASVNFLHRIGSSNHSFGAPPRVRTHEKGWPSAIPSTTIWNLSVISLL